ncbi:hypothetical protein LTR51_003579 [Lithohypha guttulata]|nr:hypothetical protein LTR51_003579 [Lithohypha guttulata]
MLFTLAALSATAVAVPLMDRSVHGPVIPTDFQDPSVLKVGDTYHGFAGLNGDKAGTTSNVITATSKDFSTWTVDNTDALPYPGAWVATVPHVWAPDIVQLANGRFVLYYSATTAEDISKHCVGVATSDTPKGPFVASDTPLYCDLSIGGAIDADGFRDPATGKQYVVYKVDGNSLGNGGACKNTIPPIMSTPIILQEVNVDDGATPIGQGITLLTNNADDGPVIEAPTLAYNAGTNQYVMFFTSGCFTSSTYNIQYATAPSVTGPYTRGGVFLRTGDTAANVYAPGSPDVEATTNHLVFHGDLNMGWFAGDGSTRDRGMYASAINWNRRGRVAIGGLQ